MALRCGVNQREVPKHAEILPAIFFGHGNPMNAILESHGERELWVHRKGSMSAQRGQPGVLPGSMGSPSFHVEGRGCEEALCSSAHGAGRALSRSAARSTFSDRELRRQMDGVWYDYRLTGNSGTRLLLRTRTFVRSSRRSENL